MATFPPRASDTGVWLPPILTQSDAVALVHAIACPPPAGVVGAQISRGPVRVHCDPVKFLPLYIVKVVPASISILLILREAVPDELLAFLICGDEEETATVVGTAIVPPALPRVSQSCIV